METIEIKELKEELNKKNKEIELLKIQLENKKKLFDSTKIEDLLNDLKSNVIKQRENLIKNNKHTKVQNKSLFHLYQDSKLFSIAQKIKKVPFFGKMLLFIKQNILNWK